MRLVLAVVAVLAGCQPDPKDFPPGGGGGGGGAGGGGGGGGDNDAATDAPSNPITGRVCLITDLRQPSECAVTGADNFTVTLDGNEAITVDDGTFTIEGTDSTGVSWRVTDDSLVTSIQALGIVHQIPAIRQVRYDDLLNQNGIILAAGQGSIVVEVTTDSLPESGALVTSNPATANGTRYDSNSANIWDQDSTGNFGVGWMAGVAVGPAIVTADPITGSNGTSTIAVEEASITFVKIDL